jgi:hypothetical protein
MTISLNGAVLQDDLILDQDLNYPASAQSIKYTVLGSTIIQTTPLSGGEEVYLRATRSGNQFSGWFTRVQIQDIKILEKNGTLVEFVYGSMSFNVVVKSGGVNVDPLIPSSTIAGTDKYTGIITLIKV